MKTKHQFGRVVFTTLPILLASSVYAFADVAMTDPGAGYVSSPIFGIEVATYGYQFTIGPQDLSVTAFGVWDSSAGGLATNHQVGLWDASGTLLESATTPAGTLSTDGSFCYQSLPEPVILSADATYTIGATYVSRDPDGLQIDDVASPIFSTDIGPVASRYILSQFAFPTDSVGGAPYVGPNFQYTVVPEPSLSRLLVLGIAALLSRRFLGAKWLSFRFEVRQIG
jgi:hypothetical protein